MSDGTKSAARPKVEALLDANSFVELGAGITARSTDFNVGAKDTPSDGVVCGHGLIDGNLVFVYAQDKEVLGGSIGEMHARKICSVYDMAEKMGAPVIGILDSTGVRLTESFDALDALGSIYARAAKASGVVPQITAITGNCGGGLATLAGLSDFVFMADDAKLFYQTPDSIPGNSAAKNDTASAAYHFEVAGDVDGIGSENDIFTAIRNLVTMLPGSLLEDGRKEDSKDDLNRASIGLSAANGDARVIAAEIADSNYIFEVGAGSAKDMLTAFIRLGGLTVGVVGNADGSNTITGDGAAKAVAFVKFCDSFEIPVLSLVNVTGYERSEEGEKYMPRSVARLVMAFAEASVGKITLVTGKAYGSAMLTMNSKAIGADMVFALAESDMGIMDAKAASAIASDISQADFASRINGTANAVRRGTVDRVLAGEDVRKYLIDGFDMLYTKREETASYKKHSAK